MGQREPVQGLTDDIIDEAFRAFITLAMICVCLPIALAQDGRKALRHPGTSEDLQELIAAEPFNAGFLATPAQTGPTSASGLTILAASSLGHQRMSRQ